MPHPFCQKNALSSVQKNIILTRATKKETHYQGYSSSLIVTNVGWSAANYHRCSIHIDEKHPSRKESKKKNKNSGNYHVTC